MFRRRLIGLLLGASLWTQSARAQEQAQPIFEITYESALALAREQSPTLAAARARAREAESHIDAASVWRFNPQLSGSAGPRFRSEGPSDGAAVDWSVSAQQWLEVGGQRGERLAAARAGADAGIARSEDAQRLLLRDVSFAFISALYWERRIALAEENLRIAEAVARVASRRHEVGEVGGLEQSVSALAVARARTDLDRARASLTQAEGRLKALLGLEAHTDLACLGDLRQLGIPDMAGADVSDRPDMRALQSDIRQAEAEADLGRAGRVPDLALGAGYAREEFDDIVQGTLTIALPVFDHGQGTTAVAQARRFVDFHPDAHRPLEGAETQAKRVLLMEQLRRWFASRNRSDYVDVRVSESSDEVSFVIIHGQPPRNLSVITSASSRDRLSLVPDKQDTVVFDKVTGRLSINAQYAAEHDFYRAAIGKVFFGRDDHFEPHAVLDCGVLLDDPRAALSVEGLPALRAVALREVVLEAIDSPVTA